VTMRRRRSAWRPLSRWRRSPSARLCRTRVMRSGKCIGADTASGSLGCEAVIPAPLSLRRSLSRKLNRPDLRRGWEKSHWGYSERIRAPPAVWIWQDDHFLVYANACTRASQD
jgi:hypothetical protein